MHRKAVKYKDVWLAPGSEGMELYTAKDFKKLDELVRACAENKDRAEGRPTRRR